MTLVVALGFFLTVFAVLHQTNLGSKADYSLGPVNVRNAQDLDNASQSLDNTNLNSFDGTMNQNDADAGTL